MDDIQTLASILSDVKQQLDKNEQYSSHEKEYNELYYSYLEQYNILDFLLKKYGLSETLRTLSSVIKDNHYKK